MKDFKTVKLGKVLEDLRRRNGLSQEELEFKARLDRRTISNIENDRTTPSIETLGKIARVYDMRLSALFLEFEKKTNLLDWMEQSDSESR